MKSLISVIAIIAANCLNVTGCSSLQSMDYLTKSQEEMTQEEKELDSKIATGVELLGALIVDIIYNKQ